MDLDAGDNNFVTALHLSSVSNRLAVVEFLIRNGAKVALVDRDGDTPLHWAATKGHTKVAEVLIQNKAPVDSSNSLGWTPLHRAAYNGRLATCEYLLQRGASLQAINKDGNTPLHLACACNRMQTVEYLLTWDAPLEMRNGEGKTAAELVGLKFQAGMKDIAEKHQKAKKQPRTYLAKHAIKKMQTRTAVAPEKQISNLPQGPDGNTNSVEKGTGTFRTESPTTFLHHNEHRLSLAHKALGERDTQGFPLVSDESINFPPQTPDYEELEVLSYVEASRKTPRTSLSGSADAGQANGFRSRPQTDKMTSSHRVADDTRAAGGMSCDSGGQSSGFHDVSAHQEKVDDDLMSPWDSEEDNDREEEPQERLDMRLSGMGGAGGLFGSEKRQSLNKKFLEKYNLQKHALFGP